MYKSTPPSESDHFTARAGRMFPHGNKEFYERYKKLLAPQRIITAV